MLEEGVREIVAQLTASDKVNRVGVFAWVASPVFSWML